MALLGEGEKQLCTCSGLLGAVLPAAYKEENFLEDTQSQGGFVHSHDGFFGHVAWVRAASLQSCTWVLQWETDAGPAQWGIPGNISSPLSLGGNLPAADVLWDCLSSSIAFQIIPTIWEKNGSFWHKNEK